MISKLSATILYLSLTNITINPKEIDVSKLKTNISPQI